MSVLGVVVDVKKRFKSFLERMIAHEIPSENEPVIFVKGGIVSWWTTPGLKTSTMNVLERGTSTVRCTPAG